MSNFTRNAFSSKPVDQQWIGYLENRSNYSDLSNSENTTLVAHRDAQERILAMRESAAVVSSCFSDGMNSLTERMEQDSERFSNGLYGTGEFRCSKIFLTILLSVPAGKGVSWGVSVNYR